jgi:hypothetical protein
MLKDIDHTSIDNHVVICYSEHITETLKGTTMLNKICPVCRKEFMVYPSAKSQRCCSKPCAAQFRKRPLAERFWEKVDSSSGVDSCWPWTGYSYSFRKCTYGTIYAEKRPQLSHRIAWELSFGSIPKGLNVLHSCDNGLCCNPKHLFLGTQSDNAKDMISKGRGHKGSEHYAAKLTEANIAEIRHLSDQGWAQRKIAEKLGVCQQSISDILHRKTWTHI